MSATCDPAAQQVTAHLGFDCHHVSSVVSVRNPFALTNWTMPILELLIIAGAVFALVHAIRRYRQGDPVNLALWFAPLVYLMVTEPPLYFPEWFGLDHRFGFIFAHNLFTVQFMWDRLPLYIVAFYPALAQLAYELVRVLGVFRRGPLAGSVAVAFVCQVFYEIFDQLGPQLKWWAWNDGNVEVNHPMMASVPLNSMVLFASASFGVLTYLVVRLTAGRRGWSLTWRILLAGVLAPPSMALAGIPSGAFRGHVEGQAWALGIELGLIWIVGVWVLFKAVRRPAGEVDARFARAYPAAYLVVLAVLWVGALPAYFGAVHGLTSGGTPIGSGPYVLACFAAATVLVAAVFRAGRTQASA
ncbi:hypothetical protein Back2_27250 [Nocardioides baekrokdamisoli]|uniref:Uncharacterized protein n=1 Tax=Nocardioides baekrokdamisoli TaxID=1804624 RepID=A0A3G9J475_9ACTN|nr:hypothetical protein [Nocardioides baekrokdamisoli]BBH18438.1 hypothetical protein Back2_27250 [Nocardioides baekrokdamisoli]